MPLYTYQCECNNIFDEFNSVKSRNYAICPECNSHNVKKMLSSFNVDKDTDYRDRCGEKIDFPKTGQSYFDKALRRTFHSPKEKRDFMNKNKIVMDGSSDKPKSLQPVEAGADRTGGRVYST